MAADARRRLAAPLLAVASVALALAASLFLALGEIGRSESETIGAGGTLERTRSSETLLESEGSGVLVLLALPVAATAAALLAQRTRHARAVATAVTVLLGGFALVGIASIGLLYMPAVLAIAAAAATTDPREPSG